MSNRYPYLPDKTFFDQLYNPDPENPLRILFSGCLAGYLCGFDGSSYGDHLHIKELITSPKIKPIPFCPEDHIFGTPRALCNIHGGDGFDVLDNQAKVLTENGVDWSEQMISGAEAMLKLAKKEKVHFAIMMDISAACGSQVIYDGHRMVKYPKYQTGAGVCAALLIRNGFRIMTQRDFRTLELLRKKIDPEYTIDPDKRDHREDKWYQSYFN